ncbi:Na(+)/H(+) antiporter subunit B [Anaplasma capra]|uniref:Na(+)/H(+) antiporter subunit B n=1 Tax=Anaplasma capra TaxID=1562740 RepID=UPI0021D5D2F6|nr:Na(+)/H(+) antiporter subunit B [Anaplasma capra]MCU7611519.1 Na(+)/H(+) antiporter subunit B [Anaplasma capra]MCU7612042.1 Na(+)/H(+) antiporter subunit B [Anaplasma capra]
MFFDTAVAVNWILLLFLAISATSVALCENLLTNTIVMCVFSLTMATSHLVMSAPDVAITEAAVGAGLSTLITFIVLSRLGCGVSAKLEGVWGSCGIIRLLLAISASLFMFSMLVYAALDLPEFGNQISPANSQAAVYLKNTNSYVGIPNVVTAILASFRGYDTMCETLVVFTAAMCVSLLLDKGKVTMVEKKVHVLGENPALRYAVTVMFPVIMLYGLYVQIHGDYSPGGGFQGGVIVASALILYSIVFGNAAVARVVPVSLLKIMAAVGLLLYFATGAASMFLGKNFLSYFFAIFDSVSEQKLGIFVVELGVGLVVCGSMVSIYFDFASQEK